MNMRFLIYSNLGTCVSRRESLARTNPSAAPFRRAACPLQGVNLSILSKKEVSDALFGNQ